MSLYFQLLYLHQSYWLMESEYISHSLSFNCSRCIYHTATVPASLRASNSVILILMLTHFLGYLF